MARVRRFLYCKGYLELFGQWPIKVNYDPTPGRLLDAQALSNDWEKVGDYLKCAIASQQINNNNSSFLVGNE